MKQKESRIQQAVAAVLAFPRLEDAARHCGVSRTTLWRWMQEEGFEERLDEARAQLTQQILDRLQHNALEAVEVLGSIVRDNQAVPSSRAAASVKTLDLFFRANHQSVLQGRLELAREQLEAAEMRAMLSS
jgi:AraC-like DNA-binding protein